MFGLGVPTTRALGIISSDSTAYRDGVEPCSIVLRASKSWIRFGSFEFAYVSEDNPKEKLQELADFVINESYPHLKDKQNKYEEFYFEVVDKTLDLMVHWQSVGFMHGVMNTDNMSIDGLTIDYGPFAFMEEFSQDFICNKSDYEGRYRFDNQPFIGQWNLSVLAKVLEPIANLEITNSYNDNFIGRFKEKYFKNMCDKLGINNNEKNIHFVLEMFLVFEDCKIDYTVFFYYLSNTRYSEIIDMTTAPKKIEILIDELKEIIKKENLENRLEDMKKINPKYILKNYMLQDVIKASEAGDYTLLNDMLEIAQNPYDEHPKYDYYSKPTPKALASFICSCSS